MGNAEALDKLVSEAQLNDCTLMHREKVNGSMSYTFRCKNSHEFTTRRSALRRRGYWCPTCTGAVQRYTEESARTFMLSVGLEPLEPYVGSRDPWLCKCVKCGKETKKRLRSVQQTGTKIGCQTCSARERNDLQRTDETVAVQIMLSAMAKPL